MIAAGVQSYDKSCSRVTETMCCHVSQSVGVMASAPLSQAIQSSSVTLGERVGLSGVGFEASGPALRASVGAGAGNPAAASHRLQSSGRIPVSPCSHRCHDRALHPIRLAASCCVRPSFTRISRIRRGGGQSNSRSCFGRPKVPCRPGAATPLTRIRRAAFMSPADCNEVRLAASLAARIWEAVGVKASTGMVNAIGRVCISRH